MTDPRIWSLASGLANVEGPAVGPSDWIVNVNSLSRPEQATWPTRAGDVTATRVSSPGETYLLFSTSTDQVSGIPAELAFGPDGAIYIPDEGRRSVVRVTPDLRCEDLITHFGANRLNGPNGVCFDPAGNMYFTDPWSSSPKNPIAAVYGRNKESGELVQIDQGMQFTNGIVVRGSSLYVAETFTRTVWVYQLDGRGGATARRKFCELPDIPGLPPLAPVVQEAIGVETICGPDGLAFDADGRLYVAHYGSSGVYVYDPDGSLDRVYQLPGRNPTNVCFAGARHDQLLVTLDDLGEIVVLDIGVAGDRVPFTPGDSDPWASVLQAAASSAPLPTPPLRFA